MQVIVVAFNKDRYQKEILRFDNIQLRAYDNRVHINIMDIVMAGGFIGRGAAIDPADFPEMVRFVVKIKE
jgi:hypothetical protein